MKVRVHNRGYYDLVCTPDHYIFGFRHKTPAMMPLRLPMACGEILWPGDIISYIGGPRTSAGFYCLDMLPDCGLMFAGVHIDDDDAYLLCFDRYKDGRLLPTSSHDYPRMYYGYIWLGQENCLCYTLPGNAGRVVETATIKFLARGHRNEYKKVQVRRGYRVRNDGIRQKNAG